ncbi:MAG: zinc ABC transporter substrate-binding protein [Chloroflexi bacterium]|nr:zinc ABC transporter substrate-binding protein [Chloroflexota bacterium]
MKFKRIFPIILIFIILLTGCAGPAASEPASSNANAGAEANASRDADSSAAVASSGKLNVITTVSPITNVIYNVGGDRINLSGIVPEGVNSHTFEPAPSDAQKLAQADLIFVNGLKLEEPTLKLAEANKKDGAEIILLGEQTITPDEYLYDFSFPKEAGSPNPHLWPNPMHALRYAEIARDVLVRRDPANADIYKKNYDAFKARIEALDKAIMAIIASIPEQNRKLLTYHDSWAYFAPRYGMTVIGAIQPSDFAEPSAQEVAALITQLKTEKVPAIFGSEVFPSPVLDQIAKEAGVQFVDTLRDDDLPGKPGDKNHSYIGLMVEDMKIMATALGGKPELLADFDTSNVPGTDSAVEQQQ